MSDGFLDGYPNPETGVLFSKPSLWLGLFVVAGLTSATLLTNQARASRFGNVQYEDCRELHLAPSSHFSMAFDPLLERPSEEGGFFELINNASRVAHYQVIMFANIAASGPFAQKMYVYYNPGAPSCSLQRWDAGLISSGLGVKGVNDRGEEITRTTPLGAFPVSELLAVRESQEFSDEDGVPVQLPFWIGFQPKRGLGIHAPLNHKMRAMLGKRASSGCIRADDTENLEAKGRMNRMSFIEALYALIEKRAKPLKATQPLSLDSFDIRTGELTQYPPRPRGANAYRALVVVYRNSSRDNIIASRSK